MVDFLSFCQIFHTHPFNFQSVCTSPTQPISIGRSIKWKVFKSFPFFHFLILFLFYLQGDMAVWVRNSLGTETEYEMNKEDGKRGCFVAKVRIALFLFCFLSNIYFSSKYSFTLFRSDLRRWASINVVLNTMDSVFRSSFPSPFSINSLIFFLLKQTKNTTIHAQKGQSILPPTFDIKKVVNIFQISLEIILFFLISEWYSNILSAEHTAVDCVFQFVLLHIWHDNFNETFLAESLDKSKQYASQGFSFLLLDIFCRSDRFLLTDLIKSRGFYDTETSKTSFFLSLIFVIL